MRSKLEAALLKKTFDPTYMGSGIALEVILRFIELKAIKRSDLVVLIEKARTENDLQNSATPDRQNAVEEHLTDLLDGLEKLRRERYYARKERLRVIFAERIRYREACDVLSRENTVLKETVIDLQDRLDPMGAVQRKADREMKSEMARQEEQMLFYGSGTGTSLVGVMTKASPDDPYLDSESGWSKETGVIRPTPDGRDGFSRNDT